MKIAFIGQKGIPVSSGGVERRVQEVATRMAKMGHEVFVYARNEYTSEKISEYQGVKIIHLPSIATKHLGTITHTFLASIHAIFKKYDVVHYQAPGPSSLCWIIKIFSPGTGLVATFNSRDDQHQKWGRIAKAYLQLGEFIINKVPDKTIVVSELLRQYSKRKFKSDPTVIHNGSAVNLTGKGDEIQKWNLEKDRYFLSVSRLVRHKGIHYLIEAFKNAQKIGEIPENFKLVIVGGSAHTDDYVTYLKGLAKDNQNIIFTGNQWGRNLSQLFANALTFVQPSEAEGLSNALLEGMGYGIAPIISDISENTVVVKENGLTFENKNIKDLENNLIFAVKNPECMKRLGREAKSSVEKDYNWDGNASMTLQLYRDLLMEKNHTSLGFQQRKLS